MGEDREIIDRDETTPSGAPRQLESPLNRSPSIDELQPPRLQSTPIVRERPSVSPPCSSSRSSLDENTTPVASDHSDQESNQRLFDTSNLVQQNQRRSNVLAPLRLNLSPNLDNVPAEPVVLLAQGLDNGLAEELRTFMPSRPKSKTSLCKQSEKKSGKTQRSDRDAGTKGCQGLLRRGGWETKVHMTYTDAHNKQLSLHMRGRYEYESVGEKWDHTKPS